jgi:hypothetical protein
MAKQSKSQFTFEISLSVLNHLGRNLYRSFVTVLGEAISNSWDAGAKNVWIYIDKKNNNLIIKDDGLGMKKSDFQNKFLRIGYSKRKDAKVKPPKGRTFIGRKGIGKLALLSCADVITVVSKTLKTDYIGGVIDNTGLDKAIKKDLKPEKYPLGNWDSRKKSLSNYFEGHEQGTIIYFENIKGGIKNSLEFLKKIIALYFRFSLLDKSFNIYIDGDEITYQHLKELTEQTEFLWTINDINDPYVTELLNIVSENKNVKIKSHIKGFIASVNFPSNLSIMGMGERVTVDLFVNGRLRERDILKHIPRAKLVEDYLYGQIHFNVLDSGKEEKDDPFTSDREGVKEDSKKFQEMLVHLRDEVMKTIISDWDDWRDKWRRDGDPENMRFTKKQRKSRELFNVVAGDYTSSRKNKAQGKEKIDEWVDGLRNDAAFNFESYADCFVSENLLRKYIEEEKIIIPAESQPVVEQWKKEEKRSKGVANLSIDIREKNSDLSYLAMNDLAAIIDKKNPDGTTKDKNAEAFLLRDANEYKPMRDAVAHTALLTQVAKDRLNSVYENIKARVKKIFSESK